MTTTQRFRYSYQADELAEWLPKIETLHEEGRPVHLLMEHCYSAMAGRNSRLIDRFLAEREADRQTAPHLQGGLTARRHRGYFGCWGPFLTGGTWPAFETRRTAA